METALDKLLDMTRRVVAQAEALDLDGKAALLGRYAEDRDELVAETALLLESRPELRNSPAFEELRMLDEQVRTSLKDMMVTTNTQIDEIHAERQMLLKQHQASTRYKNLHPSAEGVYFDKKK